MNILLVDDDSAVLRQLQGTLEDAGYSIALALDGNGAIRHLRKDDTRIVICDWNMAGFSGRELCEQIRSGDHRRHTYFIARIERDDAEGAEQAFRAGADDFIHEPANAAELLMRVRAATRIASMETFDTTIFAMAKLAEMRDTETGRHVERVARYSRALARQLAWQSKFQQQVTQDYVTLIYQTSPLHDIGKVAIPDALLMKPTPLTPEEFALMKTHTTLGARTLDAAIQEYPETPFLTVARDIAATHHERWDGSGYPRGLAGEQIPLAGRIVALADVYDAMTSARPYKQPYDHLKVKDMIVKSRGAHFDPDIVDAFLACEKDFIRILAEYADRGDTSELLAA